MFFSSFPNIQYDSVGNKNYKLVTDLLKRVAIRAKVKANTLIYNKHDIREGETPEILAHRFYGDPELHWVILLVNDITDRYHQWPMNYIQFLSYVNDKYTNVNATHHYYIEQTSGNTDIRINIGADNTGHAGATAVTNLEYEEERQDQLRQIRVMNPTYVEGFVAEFEKLIKAEN